MKIFIFLFIFLVVLGFASSVEEPFEELFVLEDFSLTSVTDNVFITNNSIFNEFLLKGDLLTFHLILINSSNDYFLVGKGLSIPINYSNLSFIDSEISLSLGDWNLYFIQRGSVYFISNFSVGNNSILYTYSSDGLSTIFFDDNNFVQFYYLNKQLKNITYILDSNISLINLFSYSLDNLSSVLYLSPNETVIYEQNFSNNNSVNTMTSTTPSNSGGGGGVGGSSAIKTNNTTSIVNTNSGSSEEIKLEEVSAIGSFFVDSNNLNADQKQTLNEKRSKGIWYLVIGGIILLILLIALFVYFKFFRKK